MTEQQLFPATSMPDDDWWHTLWPDPEQVLHRIGIKPAMNVLDLCCGNGHFTASICRMSAPGKVWALDLDRVLLAEAAQRCHDQPNFHSIHGDARELAQRLGEPVDMIFIANTFHGIPDKTTLTRCAFKALKAGGKFVIINWHRTAREQTCVLGEPRGPATALRMPPQELAEIVEAAGFESEKVLDVGPFHYASIFIRPE
jgi:SAM-dependent methyltransferase